MAKEDTKFDVAVIGGGPAGIMAAIQAASPEHGRRVVLIEKNSSLAKKLLLSGGGRCNLSNAEFNLRKIIMGYNNGEFLFHAFSVFGPKKIIEFFEKIGVKTKTEKNKKIFPVNNNAEEVLEALKIYLDKNNVTVLFSSEVKDVIKKGKKLGHTIIKPMPALAPIKLKEKWVANLQGISLKDVKINVLYNGKKQFSESGEIIFTHFGISGPSVLDISSRVGKLLEKKGIKISFDLFPNLNHEELKKELEEYLKGYPKKTIKNILSDFTAEKLAEVLLDIAEINKNKIANSIPKIERGTVIKVLKNIEVTPETILGFNEAKTTNGGISLKEIDSKTMKSKIIDNLFFAGEIIDVDGKTGGFNLQMCWSTGYLAGQI
ncbi:MAG: HI0933 family flavoprotein [Parcubacteria group bacterium GW2011_GWA2_37_10]|nr:MAG: HI0933 family flavoprotein [Parcubacteria group bacterium GW2011_GWA2_37_10]